MSVTLVVVPRERFSHTQQSLNSIYAHTHHPFKLVYVDGGSPLAVQEYLTKASKQHRFTLIRTDYILTPNEARNIGLSKVDTDYVVFIDNDTTVEPGWLDALMRCAHETGAWIVGPLYLEGLPGTNVIHMAGGDMGFKQEDGSRIFYSRHRFAKRHIAEVSSQLKREPCDYVEFHCVLIRRNVLDDIGPLDEGLMSSKEHIDLCLLTSKAGGTVYFEPASVVTYLFDQSQNLTSADRSYYLLRWSPEWNEKTVTHFAKKWNTIRNSRSERWLKSHRRKAYGNRWIGLLDPVLQPLLTRTKKRRRAQKTATNIVANFV